ncbi:transposase [Sphingobacterium multivorum]|uniref:transposase n=1 Tax=Sphingobacterium multivorum TaxID=28454 RepID=UPI000E0EE729|nr:transposase [Sphingobacterium multivorum]QQT64544.1 transposase [Sphingobacterium multivorum]
MDEKTRRKFSASFKAKVAIEAIKEQQTIHELASKYEVQATQINTWKREFLDNAEAAFTTDKPMVNDDSKEKELYSKIGEIQMQVDFLKKILGK